ncbi:hypothetical protein DK37_21365 [Halomonas sp. SUBG004]|nr:hypothetical protein DK37_21365 [Halomonas sp. SUBG004]
MWANQDWQGGLYPRQAKTDLLSDYAAVFSSVEGNTTFTAVRPNPTPSLLGPAKPRRISASVSNCPRA